jgi:hypothetical protein
VPADRVAALRAAFDATMKDPAFLADAKKTRIEIDPVSGAEVQQMVLNLYDAPPEVVERARDRMGAQ